MEKAFIAALTPMVATPRDTILAGAEMVRFHTKTLGAAVALTFVASLVIAASSATAGDAGGDQAPGNARKVPPNASRMLGGHG